MVLLCLADHFPHCATRFIVSKEPREIPLHGFKHSYSVRFTQAIPTTESTSCGASGTHRSTLREED